MSLRERIIVIAAALALVFGVVYLMRTRQTGDVADAEVSETAQLAAFVAQTQEDLEKSSLTEAEACVLHMAARPWKGSPFVDKQMALRDVGDAGPYFKYTGFLDMGKQRLAIINGREYRVGDELVSGDYTVEHVDAAKVVLRAKIGDGTVTVPAEGEPRR